MRACDLQEGARELGLNLEGITLPTYLVLSSSGGAERDNAGAASDSGRASSQARLKPDDSSGCDHLVQWAFAQEYFLSDRMSSAGRTKEIWILFFSPYSLFALEIMSFKSLRWCNLEELSYADGAGEHAGIFPAHGGVQCFCSSSESVLIASTS